MAVEQIVVVCDDPRHARGKVATIERFEREQGLSLIHISEPTRRLRGSRMPSSA